jgi:lipoprotein-anchoring transpeptidase ErfK/SrfK
MMPPDYIFVNTNTQQLHLIQSGETLQTYPVSTGLKGLGEHKDTDKTPRGWHQIRAKIGGGSPRCTVFIGRRPTGEIYTPALGLMYPNRDWILTRILWLSGLEPGFNRLGDVDTMSRYIYIHGCPEEISLGRPLSHGCVRMHNDALIELFDRVPAGTKVFIGDTLRELS